MTTSASDTVVPARLTDRSRFITYQRCPRSRYLEYEWQGIGLRKVRQAIPLAVGLYTHTGLAALLSGRPLDEAVAIALSGYAAETKRRGLEMEPGEDAAYVYDETRAMIEALLRVYALRGLPKLLEQFDILEVEREDLWDTFAPGIGWMSRADGLAREKDSGDLYVLSFKTAAQWDARTDRQNQHDVQGLSEVAAIEARLGGNEKILGVKMIYLLKGRREEYPEDGGQWITQSHLLRGWSREGITGQELAWRYKWAGPDVWPDSGKPKGHTLGKGWTRFNVWEQPGGVKAWIDLLDTGTVQPDAGDPLDAVIYEPLPYFRQQQDVDDWHAQAAWQEDRIAKAVREIEANEILVALAAAPISQRTVLNALFPQHRHSCDYPSKCQFQEICFGDDTMLTNPLGSGLYERRTPNHQPERDRLIHIVPSPPSPPLSIPQEN
jgi:hypothetical protein